MHTLDVQTFHRVTLSDAQCLEVTIQTLRKEYRLTDREIIDGNLHVSGFVGRRWKSGDLGIPATEEQGHVYYIIKQLEKLREDTMKK